MRRVSLHWLLASLASLVFTTVAFAGDVAGAREALRQHQQVVLVLASKEMLHPKGDAVETASDWQYYLNQYSSSSPQVRVFVLTRTELNEVLPKMVPARLQDAALFVKADGEGLLYPDYIVEPDVYAEAEGWLSGKAGKLDPKWMHVHVASGSR